MAIHEKYKYIDPSFKFDVNLAYFNRQSDILLKMNKSRMNWALLGKISSAVDKEQEDNRDKRY